MEKQLAPGEWSKWFWSAQDLLRGFLVTWHTETEPHKIWDKINESVLDGKTEQMYWVENFGVEMACTTNLLAGLSVELILKACLKKIDPTDAVEKYSHRLSEMSNKIKAKWKIILDENLLSELEEYVDWKGKYPKPKPNKKTSSRKNIDITEEKFQKIKKTWDTLYEKLKNECTGTDLELINLDHNYAQNKANKENHSYFDLLNTAVKRLIELKVVIIPCSQEQK